MRFFRYLDQKVKTINTDKYYFDAETYKPPFFPEEAGIGEFATAFSLPVA
jgi:hypothetical protein